LGDGLGRPRARDPGTVPGACTGRLACRMERGKARAVEGGRADAAAAPRHRSELTARNDLDGADPLARLWRRREVFALRALDRLCAMDKKRMASAECALKRF